MAENKDSKAAVGYIRVSSIEDQLHIEEQMKQIRVHCYAQDADLKMVFIDEGKRSRGFNGPAWVLLENFLKDNKGKVGSIVVSNADRLSQDLGQLLLKEHELRANLGVTIEVAGGKRLEQERGSH